MKDKIIKRGLEISKSLVFRTILSKAGMVVNSPSKILKLLEDSYNKLKSYQSPREFLTDTLAEIYILMELLRNWVRGDYKGLENSKFILIVAGLLYFVSPLDAVPDFIPVVGLVDDFSLLAWLFKTLEEEITDYKNWRASQN